MTDQEKKEQQIERIIKFVRIQGIISEKYEPSVREFIRGELDLAETRGELREMKRKAKIQDENAS